MEKRALLLSVVLMVGVVGAGIYAVTSSGYLDVSEVLHRPSGFYTIKGKVIYVSPPMEAKKTGKVVLILQGKDGSELKALINVDYLEKKYGPIEALQWSTEQVVLKGYYDARHKVFEVTDVLQGCHSAYEAKPVRA